jgi:hypothetical protein
MIDRIIGVFRLDTKTFKAIETDPNATLQAAIIVIIAALLSGFGNGIRTLISSHHFFSGFISTLLWAFIGWVLWSAVSYFVGTSLFGGQATLEKMLRVIGYAYAPQFLGIIPCVGPVIGTIWSLIAGFFAIREGLELDSTKTLLTVLIGFAVYVVGYIFIAIFFAATRILF